MNGVPVSAYASVRCLTRVFLRELLKEPETVARRCSLPLDGTRTTLFQGPFSIDCRNRALCDQSSEKAYT